MLKIAQNLTEAHVNHGLAPENAVTTRHDMTHFERISTLPLNFERISTLPFIDAARKAT